MPDRLPRILVCDDTPAKRYVLTSWLRRAGYRVEQAETVAQATAILAEQPIELAVLDVHLPDGSGFDITHALAQRGDRRPPVVHVSAIAVDTTDKVAGLDSGADAYFVEPIDPDEFLSTIRALLRSSGARREAEQLAERLSQLNRAAVRLNLAETTARLASAVASAAREVLGERAVALLSVDGIAHRASTLPSGGIELFDEVVVESTRRMLDDVEVRSTVDRDELPWRLLLPRGGPARWRVRAFRSDDSAGLLAVPLTATTDNDDYLLDRIAQLTTVALGNLRSLEREHRAALLLQRSLLPATLPEPAGLEFAARYRAGELHTQVGGDFYDAFEVGDECVVAIGDVQGHSLDAAVVMAELRYSMRAYAYDGHGPAAVADRLDQLLVRSAPGVTATTLLAQVAPDRRSVRLVRAGHVPPVLVRGGVPSLLEPRGILLGLPSTHREHTVELEPGDLLVLYTDGLVERRSESLQDSLQRLMELTRGFTGNADALADMLLAERAADRRDPLDDDVAILVAAVSGGVEPSGPQAS